MSTVIGAIALGLMVIVLLIAAGSLLIVGTFPFARWWQRRQNARRQD